MSPSTSILLLWPFLGFCQCYTLHITTEYPQTTSSAPVGCLHDNGKVYAPGTEFEPRGCEHCFCPNAGGQTYCWNEDCGYPGCVDYITSTCCPECPNGSNCYAGEKIIPAGKDVRVGNQVCRCPETPSGIFYGSGQYHPNANCQNVYPFTPFYTKMH